MAFLVSFVLSSQHLLLAVGLCAFARLFCGARAFARSLPCWVLASLSVALTPCAHLVARQRPSRLCSLVCSVHAPLCRCFLSWQLIWVLACPCYLVLACVPSASISLLCGARTLTRSLSVGGFLCLSSALTLNARLAGFCF